MLRESPWGPIAVADAHVHFFSRGFFEALAAQKEGLTLEGIAAHLGWQLPAASAEEFAKVWVEELDRCGVARAAMIASVPYDAPAASAAARAFPNRLTAYAMVNPKAWRKETLQGIRGACLFPAMHGYSMHDELVSAVFEWAAKTGGIVFVHCGVLSVGVRRKLGLESAYDMRYSNPIDLHGVAMQYPQVPIVIPHFGAGFFREALMMADLCPNVYLDTSSSNSWMKYQESHLDLRQVFKRALEVVGPKRLLFGTDSSFFPRGWHAQIFEDQATALYELGVSVGDAKAIFGENFLRILPA